MRADDQAEFTENERVLNFLSGITGPDATRNPIFYSKFSSKRGEDVFQESLSTAVQLESCAPAVHPLRPITALLHQATKNLNWLLFKSIYCDNGRESIPPKRCNSMARLQTLNVASTFHMTYLSVNRGQRGQHHM